jgi:uncharacterized protein YwgA
VEEAFTFLIVGIGKQNQFHGNMQVHGEASQHELANEKKKEGKLMVHTKAKWILMVLRISPLDRIHIMKALFLLQRKAGKIPDYFHFESYLYGPCSFEVYDALTALEREGLVVRPLHPMLQWAAYYLTDRGKKEAESAVRALDPQLREHLETAVKEVKNSKMLRIKKPA